MKLGFFLGNNVSNTSSSLSRVLKVRLDEEEKDPTSSRCLDQGEHLLDNLCCLSFRSNPQRAKSLHVIQLSFLWSKREEMIELVREQRNSSFIHVRRVEERSVLVQLEENLSSLIQNEQWKDIALLLNRRTLTNNEKILDRLLNDSHWRVPGSKDLLADASHSRLI